MSLSLVAMSHTPLLHRVEVDPQVRAEVDGAFEAVRAFVREVDPELVITIGPDHYNGFFYDTMPPFCLGPRRLRAGRLRHRDRRARRARGHRRRARAPRPG